MKSFFIKVLIGLSVGLFSMEVVFAQSMTINTRGWSRQLRVFSGQAPVRNIPVRIRNNQIDISLVVRHIETLLNRSSYYNINGIRNILSSIKGQLSRLCQNLPNNTRKSSCLNSLNNRIILTESNLINRRLNLFSNTQRNRISQNLNCTEQLALQQLDEIASCSQSNDFCNVIGRKRKSCFIYSPLSAQIKGRLRRLKPSCLKKIIDQLRDEHEEYGQIINDGICNRSNPYYDRRQCPSFEIRHQALNTQILSLEGLLQNNTSISSSESSQVCRDYKDGEVRQVTVDRKFPAFNETYLVRKNNDGSYTIPLAMEFIAASDYQTYFDPSAGPNGNRQNISKSQVPNHYFEKVQKCINESANPNLIGPNGEKLNIEIQDARNSTCIPKHSISIKRVSGPNNLSNEDAYTADIDCPSIIHEVLHKVGLDDEYDQNKNQNQNQVSTLPDGSLFYGCRVLQTNSIMADHYERYCNVGQIASSDLQFCWQTACTSGSQFNFVGRLPLKKTKPRYQNYRPSHPRRNRNSFRRRNRRRTLRNHSYFRGRNQGVNSGNCSTSLLDPAHFNAILYGDCQEREDVKLFRECSALVYEPNEWTYGPSNNCQNQKKSCTSQNVLNRKLRQPSIQRTSSFRTRRNPRRGTR